jgi:hypothetical protein
MRVQKLQETLLISYFVTFIRSTPFTLTPGLAMVPEISGRILNHSQHSMVTVHCIAHSDCEGVGDDGTTSYYIQWYGWEGNYIMELILILTNNPYL